MNYTNEQINIILNKYKNIVNIVGKNHNYDNNITHLLYAIIPAMIIYYNLKDEQYIINVFNNVPLIINDVQDNTNPALFTRQLIKEEDKVKIGKAVIIKSFKYNNLSTILDSIIHEYNHAINSVRNELNTNNGTYYLRTGLSYTKFNNDLKYIEKENIMLEEIINTKQTEDIINLIIELNEYEIEDIELKNIISVLKQEIGLKYKSKAYYLSSMVCTNILNNRTFLNTLKILRFKGEIEDIDYWFDNITGEKDSFKKLNTLLSNSLKLEEEYLKETLFKNRKFEKLKENINETNKIIEKFNNNCNIK